MNRLTTFFSCIDSTEMGKEMPREKETVFRPKIGRGETMKTHTHTQHLHPNLMRGYEI